MPDLIRNRVTERDIRAWLQANGFEGGSAQLESVELYAIKRPGWKQLFRFHGTVRVQNSGDEPVKKRSVWGVALDDERKPLGQQLEVFLHDCEVTQREQLEDLSTEMLVARGGADRSLGFWPIMGMLVFFVTVLMLIATAKNLYE